jgi:hypothetical protein
MAPHVYATAGRDDDVRWFSAALFLSADRLSARVTSITVKDDRGV